MKSASAGTLREPLSTPRPSVFSEAWGGNAEMLGDLRTTWPSKRAVQGNPTASRNGRRCSFLPLKNASRRILTVAQQEVGERAKTGNNVDRYAVFTLNVLRTYRLYARRKDPKTGRRKNLGTFASRAAKKHERAVQFFKRH